MFQSKIEEMARLMAEIDRLAEEIGEVIPVREIPKYLQERL